MKKRVLIIMAMLVWIAGGTTLVAQWAEYHADVLPQDDPGKSHADSESEDRDRRNQPRQRSHSRGVS